MNESLRLWLLLRHVEIFLLPTSYIDWDEWYMHESSPFMASQLHFKRGFFYSFLYFLLLIQWYPRHHWSSIKLPILVEIFLSIYLSLSSGKNLSQESCPKLEEGGKNKYRPETIEPHLSNRRNRRRGSQRFPLLKFLSCRGCKHWRSSQSTALLFCFIHYFHSPQNW